MTQTLQEKEKKKEKGGKGIITGTSGSTSRRRGHMGTSFLGSAKTNWEDKAPLTEEWE